jgi:predicted DNA-binding transcriptional regulator AlpA
MVDDPALTAKEVAKYIGVDYTRFNHLRNAGQLKGFPNSFRLHATGHPRWRRSKVNEWLNDRDNS